jgi:hypothetical protein
VVDGILLSGDVELPVVVELAASPQRVKLQDRFRIASVPVSDQRAGAAHAVAARTLDRADNDLEAIGGRDRGGQRLFCNRCPNVT